MKLTALLKWGTVILMTLVLVGGLITTPGASAQAGAADEATTVNDPAAPLLLPVVQVTTDPADDTAPALVQMADGELLTVFVRNGDLWSRSSTDGGATWGAETRIDGCCRSGPSLARAADGTLWLAYDRDSDIWYRTCDQSRHLVVRRRSSLPIRPATTTPSSSRRPMASCGSCGHRIAPAIPPSGTKSARRRCYVVSRCPGYHRTHAPFPLP